MFKIGKKDDFPEGQPTPMTVDGLPLVICRVNGDFYAVEDRCSHDDLEIGTGELEGCELVCPRHGARFDVRDGTVTAPPAVYPIEVFEVTVRNGNVYVSLDED